MANAKVQFCVLNEKEKKKSAYLSLDLLDRLPVDEGEQIRVRLIDGDKDPKVTDPALFTLRSSRNNNDEEILRLPPNHYRDLKRFCGDDAVTYRMATINCFAPHPGINSPEEAAQREEFIEKSYFDKAADSRILVAAPHGGLIEPGTSKQAEVFVDREGFDTWITYGFGSAFPRWHISTNDIDPRSFHGLEAISHNNYEFAITLHGHVYDNLSIGGLASTSVKCELQEAIKDRVTDQGLDIGVNLYTEQDSLNGMNPGNMVNWLSEDSGIHIEQPKKIRTEYQTLVTDAIMEVFE